MRRSLGFIDLAGLQLLALQEVRDVGDDVSHLGNGCFEFFLGATEFGGQGFEVASLGDVDPPFRSPVGLDFLISGQELTLLERGSLRRKTGSKNR